MEFYAVLLPIFGVFLLGFIGERKIGFDTKSISAASLYLMTPVLCFQTFYTEKIDMKYAHIAMYSLILCFTLIAIVHVVAYIRKYTVKETCALILSSSFMNNGNYGTPVALLLFGASGFHYAIILMVVQTIVMGTVGIYFAAKGSEQGGNFRDTLIVVLKMPIMYGALAGWLFQVMGIQLGHSVLESINLVGSAAIPTIMLVLGMQLAKISTKNMDKERISLAVIIKLIISPCVAYVITQFLPVDDLLKNLMIIMAAMPSAANTTMYAIEFNTNPDYVSTATLVTTALSLVSLPIIFTLLL